MVFDVKANYLWSGHINFSINSSRAKMPIWFYVYSEGLQYGMKWTSVSKPGEIDDDRLYVNVLDYWDRNCSLKEDSCPSQYDIDQFHLDWSGSYSKDIVLYSSIINKYKFSDMDTLWESSSMIDGRKAQNLSSKFIAEKEGKVYLSFTIPIYSYSGDEYQGWPLEPSQLPENCSNVKRGQEDWLICKQQVIIEVSEETKTQIKDIEATQKKIEESQPENAYFCAQTYVKQVIKFSKSIPDPDSAEFQMTDWDIQQENPWVYIVRSYFKAENIFGTVQRHYYSCKVKYPPSDWCRNQWAEYIECKDE